MKKSISFLFSSLLLVAGTAVAQDLDTAAITDQFDTGARGNETGTGGGFGASNTDGSEFSDYSGADSTGGPIRYINTYAGASGNDGDNGETPVLAVTNVGNPDRGLLGNTIPANGLSGASDGSQVVLVSDDGGQNTLLFGETDDQNVQIEVDVYCYDQSGVTGDSWAMVAIRAGRDEDIGTINSGAYAIDREASYALVYDYTTLTVSAIVFADNYDGLANAGLPTAVGSTVVTEGWHRFKIDAYGSDIKFSVDGTEVAAITDSTVTNGRAAIGFRENGVASADERAGTFDNLKAGPATAPLAAENWEVLE